MHQFYNSTSNWRNIFDLYQATKELQHEYRYSGVFVNHLRLILVQVIVDFEQVSTHRKVNTTEGVL